MAWTFRPFALTVKSQIMVHVKTKAKEQQVYDIIVAGLISGKQPDVETKCAAQETVDHINAGATKCFGKNPAQQERQSLSMCQGRQIKCYHTNEKVETKKIE